MRVLDVPSRSSAWRDVGAPSKRAPAAYVSWRGGKGEGGEGEGRACWRDAGGPGLAVEPHLYRVPTRLVFRPPRRRSARRPRRDRRRLRAAARLSPPRLWVGVGGGARLAWGCGPLARLPTGHGDPETAGVWAEIARGADPRDGERGMADLLTRAGWGGVQCACSMCPPGPPPNGTSARRRSAPPRRMCRGGGRGGGGEKGGTCWRDAGDPGLAVEPHLYRVPTRLVFCPPRRRSARRLRRGRRRLRAAARLSPPRLWVGVGEGEPMSAVADSRGETPSRWSSCLEGGGGGRSRGLHRRAPRCDVVAWGSGLVREGKRGEEGLPSPFSHPFCRRSPSGRRHRPRPGRTTRRWRLATHQALRTTLAGRSCRLAGSAPSRP